MGDCFRGLRRKIGLATLALALMFSGEWISSHTVQDVIWFHSGKHTMEYLQSVNGVLVWQHTYDEAASYSRIFPAWERTPYSADTKFFDETGMVWQWQWRGFGAGISSIEVFRADYYFVPHFAVVVPLTLLSMYLLLSKPRSATSSLRPRALVTLP